MIKTPFMFLSSQIWRYERFNWLCYPWHVVQTWWVANWASLPLNLSHNVCSIEKYLTWSASVSISAIWTQNMFSLLWLNLEPTWDTVGLLPGLYLKENSQTPLISNMTEIRFQNLILQDWDWMNFPWENIALVQCLILFKSHHGFLPHTKVTPCDTVM